MLNIYILWDYSNLYPCTIDVNHCNVCVIFILGLIFISDSFEDRFQSSWWDSILNIYINDYCLGKIYLTMNKEHERRSPPLKIIYKTKKTLITQQEYCAY